MHLKIKIKKKMNKSDESIELDKEKTSEKEEADIRNSIEFRRKLFERLNGISSAFKINYTINPNLKYEYPPINEIILENIAASLSACPKFYVQTLHLMNKMNLPCPLVNFVRIKCPLYPKDRVNEAASTSESEMEIESNKSTTEQKSPEIESKVKKLKVKTLLKSQKTVNIEPFTNQVINISEIFENVEQTTKKTKLAAKQDDILENRVKIQSEFEGFAKMAPMSSLSSQEISKSDNNENSSTIDKEVTGFISQNELEKNRLKLVELRELPIFKNYEKGEPNTRLYVKNISKKATESDLKYIYGRYIDWNNEAEKNSFDIRLMTQGKMKGQAFITMPNEGVAIRALNDTNGYVFDEKPFVVQFARSAKPK